MTGNEKLKEILDNIDFNTCKYIAKIETSMGTISVEFFPDVAPNHCKNFIALAKSGFYRDLCFHRVISGFMIQGGCPEGTGMGGPGYKVNQEFNNRPHEPGVLSMARANDPNSAGSQFFICLEKVSYLDGQYTVFGKTADQESLAVVKSIGAVPTGAQDRPKTEVKIIQIHIETIDL